jgi:hypothetical protein
MDETLYLWEVATGEARLVSKEPGYATAVAFSPDGRWLALANAGNHYRSRGKDSIASGIENRETVRLVRVADGKVVRRFMGHLGGVGCLCFSPNGCVLASGGHDTTILLWDVTAAQETVALEPERLPALWDGLRGTAAEAHGCMAALVSSPARAISFLGGKLKPVLAPDAGRIASLLKKLESDRFDEREGATGELRKLGDAAEPALRETLRGDLSAETRRRLQALLEELTGPDRLRTTRAIEVLERIGDRDARALLRRLAEGAGGAWLTDEARGAFQRMERTHRPGNRGR